ncbi:MAG: F0F1 ATP synthase subunit alpha [Halothiobacillus sp. 35-54-62]|nr:MAG: F0F1 ATP synthase subunit alpha [Halothiobacillus sp. 35-54-62]
MHNESDRLQPLFDSTFAHLRRARESGTPHLVLQEIGVITSVATGIAKVAGLPGVGFEEVLKFPGPVYGIAFNIDEEEIGVVLLGDYSQLNAGDEVTRSGHVVDVPVGDRLIGRIINPMGRPLDGKGSVVSGTRLPIERTAPHIMDRAPVTVPLQTGIKVIDALIPIGRGQRELIIGDRQTGKTAIALDTIINQRGKNVLCVYCAIGQRASDVAKVVAALREKGALDYTVVVVTEGNDPPGLAYIAPYAATSIAEHFMAQGRDVLVVYDDLTQHARAYRELSLLLRRPPGREAFPGDIFYIHSRLLERATHLRPELGGGSLTALPIIETEAQDIAGDLKLAYAQFEELETFTRFGARLDEHTRQIIEHGRRIRACLKQAEFAPVSVAAQITILLALTDGLFDNVPLEQVSAAELALHEAATRIPTEVSARFDVTEKLSPEDRNAMIEIARTALEPFQDQSKIKEAS